MSVTINTVGDVMNLTFSDGRVMGIKANNIQRTDLIGDNVFIYQTILENNKRIYSQNPDVIKLNYLDVTPAFGSAALFYDYLNTLLAEIGGAAPTSTTLIASSNYFSPTDFTATYTSANTLTLAGLPFTLTNQQLKYIFVVSSTGESTWYGNGVAGVVFTISSNVITVTGIDAPFASGDVYEVGVRSQDKAYDPSTASNIESVLNPEWAHYTDVEHPVDAVNLAALTYYQIIDF